MDKWTGAVAASIVVGLCLATAAARGQERSVIVDLDPPQRTTTTYDPRDPPPQLPTVATPGAAGAADKAGVTVSDFSCTAVVNGREIKQSNNGSVCVAAVRVESVHITLGLKITEWVACTAGPKTLAHEDGHRMIAEHFYDRAQQTAEAIGRQLIGRDFFGSGANPAAAATDALNVAARQIAEQYMQHVRDPSQQVQDAYDRITSHGTNTAEELDAIEQAMREANQAPIATDE